MQTILDADRMDTLVRYREALVSAQLLTSRDRDKVILAMAGGALTVSAALLQRSPTPPGGLAFYLLIAGWTLEVVAVILVLYTLHLSEAAVGAERERVDCMLQGDGEDPGWTNANAERTEFWNNCASAAAVAGVILLLLQAVLSVPPVPQNTKTATAVTTQ
jgi:hypothetical protein